MRRYICFLLCLVSFFVMSGCMQQTGYSTYTGTYVETDQGRHILIFACDNEQRYLWLQEAADCRSMDSLKTGDRITIYVPCVPYEDAVLTEMTVYKWSKSLFGKAEVSEAVLNDIEELLTNGK